MSETRGTARPDHGYHARVSRSDDTRLALLRAAERLILTDGVAAVSLREIAVEAGQRNHSAVLYHFGDKRGLLDAILERHSQPIQTGWIATLKHVESWGALDLPKLVSLLVRPIVDKLDDADGGRAYVVVCAELLSNRQFALTTMRAARADGALAICEKIVEHLPSLPPALLELRMTRVASMIYTGTVDYLRLSEAGAEITREAFVTDLIEAIVAMLSAQSAERLTAPIVAEASGVMPRRVAPPAVDEGARESKPARRGPRSRVS